MPVNLSIKNVPDELAEKLRQRAKRNHRSLQGELLHLLENSVLTQRISLEDFDRKMDTERISAAELRARVKKLGLTTQGDSVEIIRADRDSR